MLHTTVLVTMGNKRYTLMQLTYLAKISTVGFAVLGKVAPNYEFSLEHEVPLTHILTRLSALMSVCNTTTLTRRYQEMK